MILSIFLVVGVIATYIWQDGIRPCPDGFRYTSRVLQPSPFHRRYCDWNPKVLTALTWASWLAVSCALGSWEKALMFATLPAVWLCSTRPTTVDGPAIACAWLSSYYLPYAPVMSVILALLGGFIHERSPIFAAIYSLNPLPLVGLIPCVVRAIRGAAPKPPILGDADLFVGHGSLIDAIRAHKPRQDFLSWEALVWSLRGVLPMAALVGTSLSGWLALGFAFASRVVATDTARCMVWAAPPLLANASGIPLWLVVCHVISFRRMI